MPVERWMAQSHVELGTARPDVRVAQAAARSHGVLSVDELIGCGLTHQTIALRVGSGRLHRLHRGVYAVGHAAPPLEGRMLAAVEACGARAVLSHASAAVLARLSNAIEGPIEVTVRGSWAPQHRGIRVHRAVDLPSRDITFRGGIPTTTPARTVLDLAARSRDDELRDLIRRGVGRRRLVLRQLVAIAQDATGRRGVARLRRVLADGLPTRSELEDVVLTLIVGAGLPRPDVNVPLTIEGRTVIPDFRWPRERLVIEADGASWHDNPIARAADRERRVLLERHGERVVRVTWKQAVGAPEKTLERIRAAGAPG